VLAGRPRSRTYGSVGRGTASHASTYAGHHPRSSRHRRPGQQAPAERHCDPSRRLGAPRPVRHQTSPRKLGRATRSIPADSQDHQRKRSGGWYREGRHDDQDLPLSAAPDGAEWSRHTGSGRAERCRQPVRGGPGGVQGRGRRGRRRRAPSPLPPPRRAAWPGCWPADRTNTGSGCWPGSTPRSP
jgi:hypothetical protein